MAGDPGGWAVRRMPEMQTISTASRIFRLIQKSARLRHPLGQRRAAGQQAGDREHDQRQQELDAEQHLVPLGRMSR